MMGRFKSGIGAAVVAALVACGCDRKPSEEPREEQGQIVLSNLPIGMVTGGVEEASAPSESVSGSGEGGVQPRISAPVLVDVEPTETYVDEEYGFEMDYPGENWRRGGPGVLVVPGELCRVWSSPLSAAHIIMVLVQRESRPITAEALIQELPQQFAEHLEATVEQKGFVSLNGRKAVTIIVSGKGNGFSLDPKGALPTLQRWVTVPRLKDTVSFVVSAPAQSFGSANRVFQMMLTSIKFLDSSAAARPMYVDKEYGLKIPHPGQGWTRGGPGAGGVYVPGEVCRIWSKASSSTSFISVFVQRVEERTTPRALLEDSLQVFGIKFGAQILKQEVKPVAGLNAMSVVVTGAGTGAALDGQGSIQTTQHWIAMPRERDVVMFFANAPSTDFPEVELALQTMLEKSEIIGFQSIEQRESK